MWDYLKEPVYSHTIITDDELKIIVESKILKISLQFSGMTKKLSFNSPISPLQQIVSNLTSDYCFFFDNSLLNNMSFINNLKLKEI